VILGVEEGRFAGFDPMEALGDLHLPLGGQDYELKADAQRVDAFLTCFGGEGEGCFEEFLAGRGHDSESYEEGGRITTGPRRAG
jgi:hypothetical protein